MVCKSCGKSRCKLNWFSWMVLKPLLNQSGLFFKNILHAFITKTIFKKTNKLGCIFVSSTDFERVRNIFGKLLTGKYKSMGLQWNCFCGQVGLLWTSVANKLLLWEGF